MSTTLGVIPRLTPDYLQSLSGNEIMITLVARGTAAEVAVATLTATKVIAIRKIHIDKSITGARDAVDIYLSPTNPLTPNANASSVFRILDKYGDFSGGQANVSIGVGSNTAAAVNAALTSTQLLTTPTTAGESYAFEFATPLILAPTTAFPNPTITFVRQSAVDLIFRVTLECVQFVSSQQGAPFPV